MGHCLKTSALFLNTKILRSTQNDSFKDMSLKGEGTCPLFLKWVCFKILLHNVILRSGATKNLMAQR